MVVLSRTNRYVSSQRSSPISFQQAYSTTRPISPLSNATSRRSSASTVRTCSSAVRSSRNAVTYSLRVSRFTRRRRPPTPLSPLNRQRTPRPPAPLEEPVRGVGNPLSVLVVSVRSERHDSIQSPTVTLVTPVVPVLVTVGPTANIGTSVTARSNPSLVFRFAVVRPPSDQLVVNTRYRWKSRGVALASFYHKVDPGCESTEREH